MNLLRIPRISFSFIIIIYWFMIGAVIIGESLGKFDLSSIISVVIGVGVLVVFCQ
jgi:hypothetical protein